MGNIFVVGACTAGKGRQGSSFVGKIFVVRPPTTNIAPRKLPAIRYTYRSGWLIVGNHLHFEILF